jgi:hypothetical protein
MKMKVLVEIDGQSRFPFVNLDTVSEANDVYFTTFINPNKNNLIEEELMNDTNFNLNEVDHLDKEVFCKKLLELFKIHDFICYS